MAMNVWPLRLASIRFGGASPVRTRGPVARPGRQSPPPSRDRPRHAVGVATIVGKAVENRYLVKQKDRRRNRDLTLVGLALAPLALVLLGFAWTNVEVIRRGYDLQQKLTARDALVEDNRQLRGQLSQLTTLDRVEDGARRLGFADPRPQQVVHVVLSSPDEAVGGSSE